VALITGNYLLAVYIFNLDAHITALISVSREADGEMGTW
jgi:hypothetical protein